MDAAEERAIVAIPANPAYMPIFDVASTREGSDVILINEPTLASN